VQVEIIADAGELCERLRRSASRLCRRPAFADSAKRQFPPATRTVDYRDDKDAQFFEFPISAGRRFKSLRNKLRTRSEVFPNAGEIDLSHAAKIDFVGFRRAMSFAVFGYTKAISRSSR